MVGDSRLSKVHWAQIFLLLISQATLGGRAHPGILIHIQMLCSKSDQKTMTELKIKPWSPHVQGYTPLMPLTRREDR